MSSAIHNKPLDLKKSLVDAVLAGLIALIVFGPIVGVVLDGYAFNLQFGRVGWIIAAVMLGRFAISLFMQTSKGQAIAETFETTGSGVHVLAPPARAAVSGAVPRASR